MNSIPVAYIRFQDTSQEGPGIHSSSVSDARHKAKSGPAGKHKLEYHPWIRMFWVEFYDRDAMSESASLVRAAYMPESCAAYWEPLDGPVMPQAKAPTAAKAKTAKK